MTLKNRLAEIRDANQQSADPRDSFSIMGIETIRDGLVRAQIEHDRTGWPLILVQEDEDDIVVITPEAAAGRKTPGLIEDNGGFNTALSDVFYQLDKAEMRINRYADRECLRNKAEFYAGKTATSQLSVFEELFGDEVDDRLTDRLDDPSAYPSRGVRTIGQHWAVETVHRLDPGGAIDPGRLVQPDNELTDPATVFPSTDQKLSVRECLERLGDADDGVPSDSIPVIGRALEHLNETNTITDFTGRVDQLDDTMRPSTGFVRSVQDRLDHRIQQTETVQTDDRDWPTVEREVFDTAPSPETVMAHLRNPDQSEIGMIPSRSDQPDDHPTPTPGH